MYCMQYTKTNEPQKRKGERTMTKYDYREAMKNDIKEYLDWEGIEEADFDELYDNLFVNDSITGNASGSYTFNRWKAEEYVIDNMSLAAEAFKEFCDTERFIEWLEEERYEAIDVTIRCYLLAECLAEVLEN